jgi:hypothetical protein
MLKGATKRVIEAVVRRRASAFVVNPVLRASAYALGVKNRPVVSHDQPQRAEGTKLINDIHRERDMLLSLPEAYSIFSTVQRTAKVPGDIAEVGVYQGGSAKLICEAKGARQLHLFDTFQGLPPRKNIDPARFTECRYACSLESVQQYLRSYSRICFYKGLFPETAHPVNNCRFSFVHLDVDLYESTRSSLEYFYPRMPPGAVILSHDYVTAEGVRAAFDEFFEAKVEPVIELVGDQCMVVKVEGGGEPAN